jgi:gamma-glutamyl:cysteine ligase YbdK (ATP-grasp superfamily)
MGEAVEVEGVVDPTATRLRLDRSVQALETMVASDRFDTVADTCGFEAELDLVDSLGRPRHVNGPVLRAMRRVDVQTELQQFNLEYNLEPRPISGRVLSHLEDELTSTFTAVSAMAQQFGARVIAIGTLPTLHAQDLTAKHLSASPRYPALDAVMSSHRGHDVHLAIASGETFVAVTDSISVQGAATSFQIHVRVTPQDFPRRYNAAQAYTAAQLAAGANSPYLLGARLWDETRIVLIEQSLDIRPLGRPLGAGPSRAWIGGGWARSATDLIAENVTHFDPLFPLVETADPIEELQAGATPSLHDLRLHNGTIWRWNRPVYDVQHDHPHLRIENRVLPGGPTSVDMVANAAFFIGACRAVADLATPVEDSLPFDLVDRDMHAAARDGLRSQLHWPGRNGPELHGARRLLLDTLIPLAEQGLAGWGVDRTDAQRYLDVLRQRVRSGRTGATWQTETVQALETGGADRAAALREMVRRYVDNAATGRPVHTWTVEPPG